MKGTHASATLIGRVGRDAEIFGSGEWQTVSFSIATVSGRGQHERTNWWDIKLISKSGERLEFIRSIATKGARLFVTGELVTRSYTPQSGGEKIVTELMARDVLPLDPRTDRQEPTNDRPARDPQPQQRSRPRPAAFDTDLDDDVPF